MCLTTLCVCLPHYLCTCVCMYMCVCVCVFSVVKKHNAAREVFNKLPADSINVVYKIWHAKVRMCKMQICYSFFDA